MSADSLTPMSGLDDTGRIVNLCPICQAWSIEASVDVLGWPLAGLLVEEAIARHVDEHLGVTVQALSCGCVLRIDEPRDLAHLTPCSGLHRQIAQTNRSAHSRIIVGPVVTH